MKKGCLSLLAIFALAYAGEYFALENFQLLRPWYVPLLLALGVTAGAGSIMGLIVCLRRRAAVSRPTSEWKDGMYVALGGHIYARSPLRGPFSDRPAAIYEYEVLHTNYSDDNSSNDVTDYVGYGMTKCEIQSPMMSIQLVGYPILANFPTTSFEDDNLLERAASYFAATSWAKKENSVFKAAKQLNDVLNDEDGELKVDYASPKALFALYDPATAPTAEGGGSQTPVDYYRTCIAETACTITERVVEPGAEVCAFGTFRSNPPRLEVGSGMQKLSHALYPGKLDAVAASGVFKSLLAVSFWCGITAAGHYFAFILRAPP